MAIALMFLVCAVLLASPSVARADALSSETSDCLAGVLGPTCFRPNIVFHGASPSPGSDFPYFAASVTDAGFNSVYLQMVASLEEATQRFYEVYFNVSPALEGKLSPTDFLYNPNPGTTDTGPQATLVKTGIDIYQPDGDGKFDIRFRWGTQLSTVADQFDGSNWVTYRITCTSCIDSTELLTPTSFDFMSAPRGYLPESAPGPFRVAVVIEGVGAPYGTVGAQTSFVGGKQDSAAAVPEPGLGTLLLASALTALGGVVWKRFGHRRPEPPLVPGQRE